MDSKSTFAALAAVAVQLYTGADKGYPARIAVWVSLIGDRDYTTLTPEDVEDAIDRLKVNKRHVVTTPAGIRIVDTGKPMAPATCNRYISSLGTLFIDARKQRLTPRGFRSPTLGVERFTPGPGRTVDVSAADIRRLIDACRLSRNRKLAAIVAFMATTGWRLGNVQSLRWNQVNLDEAHVSTPKTKNGTPHRAPLQPWVVEELRNIRTETTQPTELVFGASTWRKAFETALRIADLPTDWSAHHLRHVSASVLAQAGASTVTIMAALGHKSPSMAARYVHQNIDSLREATGKAWA
jgi:integrase